MRLTRKAIVAVAVTGAVAAGGAAAYAATNGSSGPGPQRTAHGGYAGHGHFGPGPALPSGARDVVEQIKTAVLDQAPGIVNPILDQAVTAGKLSAAQAATAKQALADVQAGKRPSADAFALLRDADVRAVAADAFQALAKQVPGIAKPILADAVSKGTIDQATADAITEHIQDMADHAAQGGFPFGGPGPMGPGGHRGGPFGPGYGGHGGPMGPGHRGGPFGRQAPSAATAAVFGDVAQAIAKQTPSVAGPIVDKAVADGKITKAQGDELKRAADDLASDGRGALFAHRDLLADANVRDVVRDVAKALATQAPAIAKPIVDKAVADGKITQAEADKLTQHIADAAKRAGG